ncbi:MAG: peptidase M28, partial [Calditrichaeota bacterium]
MKVTLFISTILLPCLLWSQPITQKRDAEIAKMVEEISAEHLEALVNKLVSFHTRHSLSDTVS